MTQAASLPKRLGTAGLLVLPLLAFPYLAGLLLRGGDAAFGAVLGSFIAFLMCVGSGWRVGALAMPVAVVVAGAAAVVHGSPAWVLLLAVVGVAAGGFSRIGLLSPAAMTGVMASIAPPQQWSGAGVFVLFLALGAANAVLLARRLGLPQRNQGQQFAPGRAAAVSAVLGAMGALSAAIAVRWDAPHAYWLPMTVFLIAVPSAGVLMQQKAVARLIGTVAGVAGTALLLPLGLPRPVDLLLGALCLMFSLAYLRPMWVSTTLSSAATVLLLTGVGANQLDTSVIRVEAVVLGSVLILAGMAAVALIARLRPPTRDERALARNYDPSGVHG